MHSRRAADAAVEEVVCAVFVDLTCCSCVSSPRTAAVRRDRLQRRIHLLLLLLCGYIPHRSRVGVGAGALDMRGCWMGEVGRCSDSRYSDCLMVLGLEAGDSAPRFEGFGGPDGEVAPSGLHSMSAELTCSR